MSDRTIPDSFTTTVEASDTKFGFTWGVIDGEYYLRTPDRQYKGVTRHVVETLKAEAPGTGIDDLIATVAEQRSSAADVLREMYEEGFIREGASVKRIEPPPDIRIWNRLLVTVLLFVVTGGLAVYAIRFADGAVLENRGEYLLETLGVSIVALVGALTVHEFGHHHTASRQGLNSSIDVTVVNGVLPAVVTRTNDSWALPRNRRIWITLAGPVYGLVWTLGIFVLYFTTFHHQGVAVTGLISFNMQVGTLIPIFHGDGYFLVTDVFGQRNLRPRGIDDLRNRRATWPAVYVVFSYGIVAGVLALDVVIAYLVGDYWGVGVVGLLFAIALGIHLWQR